jgi:DNA-binding NtrC family response regulator
VSPSTNGKVILIIDRQPFWRDKVAATLTDKGYVVRVMGEYAYPSPAFMDPRPDLIILGCSRIKHEERQLINEVLADHRHLVVLCASLPWGDMRALFLAGADDVVDDKPYDADRITRIVEEAFAGMSR